VKVLKTDGFIRVRVGISPVNSKGLAKKPTGEEAVNKFILGKFKPAEMEEMKKLSEKITEALLMIVSEGYPAAMGKFNG
jgi:peptidyl-tRNA hydrolase